MNRIMGESGVAPASNGNGNGTMHANGTAEKQNGAAATVEKPGKPDTGAGPGAETGGAATTAHPQRDKLGRYIPGNNGGPGNPFGRHVAWNRRLILTAISDEEVIALVRKVYGAAMEGDIPATKLLLQYLVGKPQVGSNPDRVDHEEWEMRMEQPCTAEFVDQKENRYPHRATLMMHRVFDVCKCKALSVELKRQCAEEEALRAKQKARAEKRRQRKNERQRRRK